MKKKHYCGWKLQWEEINLWEERKQLGIKLIEHNLLKDNERLIAVDNRLLQIRKEYENMGALLDTKEWEILNIPKKISY